VEALVKALAVAVLAVAVGAPADGGVGGVLGVRLSGLRSDRGKVGCTLYNGPKGFPTDPKAALQQRWCAIQAGASACRFDPVPAGSYAVACFHDENDNGVCDTGLFGIPTEGTVVSNHAKGTLGPPKYEAAKFTFSGQASDLALKMAY
jgi:uncharacterized protein (DUF2141 family)